MNDNKQRKSAFSLIEIMIALTIMSVLLSIILIPLRLGFDSLHVGQARNNNQTAIQSTLSDIETDLRQAVYVFPNTEMVGITDQAPFTATIGTSVPPYTRAKTAGDTGANGVVTGCPFTNGEFWSNTSRIDMIPAARDTTGNIILPLQPGNTVVTYYARRLNLDPLKQENTLYDPVDNPIVLYRAQYAYNDKAIADVTDTHGSCPSGTSFTWLAHNVYGEADLSRVTSITQTLATPRGLGLVASRAFRVGNGFPTTGTVTSTTEAPFKPDSSFTCLDTNGDGKIDRVNISLAIASFDSSGNSSLRNGQPAGQNLRAERTVVLPNIQ